MDDRRAEYDPAKLLTRIALLFVGSLIFFVGVIILLQMWFSPDHEASTSAWAALTGLIGWATSQVSIIFSNRYGTTQQATTKDAVIAQQSKTAAVIAAAASPTAQTPPVVVDTMTVKSENTVVSPKE